MESQSPLQDIPAYSFSRAVSLGWRQTLVHRLQFYRWVLGLAMAFHFAPNMGKLYWHYNTHHTPSVFPDSLAFVLCIVARSTCFFLFRDPTTFLGCERPGRKYVWLVSATVTLITLPNCVVHIWALQAAFENDFLVLAGILSAIWACVTIVPLNCLVWWMAWKYLLTSNESRFEFEPTLKRSHVSRHEQRSFRLGPAVEPYTDDVPAHSTLQTSKRKHLSEAYIEQRDPAQEPQSYHVSAAYGGAPQPMTGPQRIVDPPQTSEQAPVNSDETHGLRCQTIARFDYMSQSQYGVHSWFSYPLVPFLLTIYATALLIFLPVWIHEDRKYRLRAPSRTLKTTFYLPLGLYLLAFYGLKHRIRASLYEHFDISPPEPWNKLLSILPGWFGTGGTFKNTETGALTVYDPRRRAFPWRAYRQPSLIHTFEYIAEYNASPCSCNAYWGHLGRTMKTDFRTRSTAHRIGFVLLATYLASTGFFKGLAFDVPNIYEEEIKHPGTVTDEDVACVFKLLKFWQAFIFSGKGFILLSWVYAIGCMGSTAALFVSAVWKHVPEEEKRRVNVLAHQQEQIRGGGHVRLE